MSGLVFCSILLLITAWSIGKLLEIFWWKPRKIQKLFLDQGIGGPPYKPFIGSIGELAKIYTKARTAQSLPQTSETNLLSNTLPLAFPHLPIWREKYGSVYLYWYGRQPRLSISDPELIKGLTSAPRKYYQSIQHPLIYNLIGKSVLAAGGEPWNNQRKLLNPFFLVESLKNLPNLVVDTVDEKIETWKSLMKSNELEVDACKEFENITQDIIVQIMLGNDAKKGLQIAHLQSEQTAIASKLVKIFYIPGTKFIPIPLYRRSKRLRREVEMKFHGIIERRLQNVNQQENDWLSLMLSSGNMTKHQIIDECCAMFIAGSESTNILLAWTCVHLGINKMWQDKARDEIFEVLHKENRPLVEILSRLKIVTMIINETLRLCPAVPFIMKHAQEDIKLGELTIPSGIDIEVPIISVHHEKTIWGENASQFDPSRFSEGISKASKHPMAFMPFMNGPRICLGMNFAMIEAKVTLAMILQNFDISISPKYKHVPVGGLTLKQGSGAPVIFRKI
ncbi:hypothetical protein IEQ34_016044 [Dendrobium chrysotoxum]|uniref:Cytochrome P450 n=1 Tax=Dendrobium chrysotoxum TaxID=161865 RepID=A0AAV7GD19_DENCH|nr:hypothetical protein IEQ34_016044 [Dendrobium chrysotoxum]